MSITFHFGHHKQFTLDTPEIYDDAEFWDTELPPNYEWITVTVKNVSQKETWIAAKNAWLSAFWTPNQSDEERVTNASIMIEAERVMNALNIS
jgi:hypothetical protein